MSKVELVKTETREAVYKRKPISLPIYEVRLNGQPIGFVRRSMITRERRSEGKRYVDARWSSPGWVCGADKWGRHEEAASRRDGIERLLHDAGKSWGEAAELSLAAKVVR